MLLHIFPSAAEFGLLLALKAFQENKWPDLAKQAFCEHVLAHYNSLAHYDFLSLISDDTWTIIQQC